MARFSFIIIIAIVAVASTMVFLAFAITQQSPKPDSEHGSHLNLSPQPPLTNLEQTANLVRGGYANNLSNFDIDNGFLDPDNSCEFCTKVSYTPVKGQFASIVYQIKKSDFTGSQRMVFFAMGQRGGEEIQFVTIGKNDSGRASKSGETSPKIHFAKKTEKLQLSNTWNRFEIDLRGTDLSDVAYPFGFVIAPVNNTMSQVFYLKGVSFDNKLAQYPIVTNNGE